MYKRWISTIGFFLVFLGACSESTVDPETQKYLGTEEFLGFADLLAFISVVFFNYFFAYMNHILRGRWYSLSPTWRWLADIKEINSWQTYAPLDPALGKSSSIAGHLSSASFPFLARSSITSVRPTSSSLLRVGNPSPEHPR